MKTLILFLALLCGAVAQTAPVDPKLLTTGYIIQDAPITAECYVKLTDKGEWRHESGVYVNVLSMTEGSLILECDGTIAWHSRMSVVMSIGWSRDTHKWREIYAIENGKLVLRKIQRPTVTPAVESKTEWGKDDIEIK